MSPAAILDEFTHLPVSRRRKYQMRMAARGCCVVCGQVASHGFEHGEKHPHCEYHWYLFKNRKVQSARRARQRAQG